MGPKVSSYLSSAMQVSKYYHHICFTRLYFLQPSGAYWLGHLSQDHHHDATTTTTQKGSMTHGLFIVAWSNFRFLVGGCEALSWVITDLSLICHDLSSALLSWVIKTYQMLKELKIIKIVFCSCMKWKLDLWQILKTLCVKFSVL